MPTHIETRTRGRRRILVAVIAPALTALLLGACGTDDQDTGLATGPATGDANGGATPNTAQALTVENLAEHCDRLAPIIGSLRGTLPAEVSAHPTMDASINGFRYRTAHCTFAHPGDSFSDPNRVDIYLDTASDAAAMRAHWDTLASTEVLAGIGDEASWHASVAVDARSSARALLGPVIISVRVSVPKQMAGEQFLTKQALSVALGTVVAQLHWDPVAGG